MPKNLTFLESHAAKVHITPVVSNAGAIKGLSSNFLMATPVISKSCKNETKAEGQDVIDETI